MSNIKIQFHETEVREYIESFQIKLGHSVSGLEMEQGMSRVAKVKYPDLHIISAVTTWDPFIITVTLNEEPTL